MCFEGTSTSRKLFQFENLRVGGKKSALLGMSSSDHGRRTAAQNFSLLGNL